MLWVNPYLREMPQSVSPKRVSYFASFVINHRTPGKKFLIKPGQIFVESRPSYSEEPSKKPPKQKSFKTNSASKIRSKRHMRTVHYNVKKFACTRCNHMTHHLFNMHEHMSLSHGFADTWKEPIICTKCNFATASGK
jgi:hypothetical protein